ncbi:MAG: tetratricopeptide repeat protein [Deltaproteobacteria bacterium]
MKIYYLILALAIGVNGCTEIAKRDSNDYIKTQTSRLQSAKRLIIENKISAATETLNSICSAKGIPGITDEAMFRLALLYLGEGHANYETIQAQQTLERLQKEFPGSSWKTHSASLNEFISTLNRKIRALKGDNLSLSRENRALRLNIEKLKLLDVEQELRGRR